MARFHLANIRERLRLFRPNRIAAGIASRAIDHGDRLVLLLNQLGQVGGDVNLVIRANHPRDWISSSFQKI